MNHEQNKILQGLEQVVRQSLASSPRCHDIDHTLRVCRNAGHLGMVEGGDLFIIRCAALLHDIGRGVEMADQGGSCHAVFGAEQAPAILASVGVTDPAVVEHVAACVATHRYRGRPGREQPRTIEAKIVFDADKLDSMGAIGIGRAFHFAGRIGARVHNRAEEALQGDSYGPQDSALREYLIKLRYLKDCLLTDEGRRLGASRCRFMEIFFQQLDREVAGEDLPVSGG